MKTINKSKVFEKINYVPHEKQKLMHEESARFRIFACGRRFGKSKSAAREAIFYLMHPSFRGWVVAPTYTLSEKVMREVFYCMNKYLPEFIAEQSEAKLYIKTIMNSELWGKSADNPVSLLGEGIDFLIIDECAQIKEIIWNQYLRPTLSDRKGIGIFISTPQGRNWFHNLYIKGQDKTQKIYMSYNFPTYDNPYIPKEEIDEARTQIPERTFRQEYMAEFLTDEGAVFRAINSCIKGDFEKVKPDHSYIMGVDIAKHEDFTVIFVIDVATSHVVYFDRFHKIDWPLIYSRIENAARTYNDALIWLDATGIGDPVYDELVIKRNLKVNPFKFTHTSKKNLVDRLSMVIEKQEITYPEIPELINELNIYEYERTRDGTLTDKTSAPSGSHDDCFVKGTLITTPKGQIPIEQLKVGDFVTTRKGARMIVATKNRLAKVINKFGFTGTPEHPMFTTKGIKKLRYLKETDTIYIWNPKTLNTEEKLIGDIRTQNTGNSDFISGIMEHGRKHQLHYTDKCGLTTLEKLKKDMSFITKMKTLLTIPYQILNSLQGKNIPYFMQHQNKENNQEYDLKKISQKYVKSYKYGGKAKDCENMEERWSNSYTMHQNMNTNVYSAKKSFLAQELLESNSVHKNVAECIERVYNIQVDREPEYFANYILVHNCVMALGLACMGLGIGEFNPSYSVRRR